ncbi:MAG TPA: hypothetical protein VG308_17910 [Stellaceae bacterium]|nr:hypothetical protein [Stellaceae bacterium]
MKRLVPAGFALALGLAAIAGCVPPPAAPAEIAIMPPPAPPPPVALAVPVAVPVEVPVVRHHPVHVAHFAPHRVVHRHWVRRTTVMRTTYAPLWPPQCGSVSHPCNVDHTTAPIQ